MNEIKILTVKLGFLSVLIGAPLLLGCTSNHAFQSFQQCQTAKTAEYLDAGGSSYDSAQRAVTFCELSFPLLPAKYVQVGPVGGRLELLQACSVQADCPQYRLWLASNRDFVTFSVTTANSSTRTYERVHPTNGGNIVVFSPGGEVLSFTVTESYIDVNKGKHLGE